MTFGEKLKQLRKDNNMTQEDLAQKIFVTRTAISKWETGKGLPAIDSLKLLSELFHVSIDDLISESDIETKRSRDENKAKVMYGIAICSVVLAALFALLAYFLEQPYFYIGALIFAVLYIVFGLLSKPRFRRAPSKKAALPYAISYVLLLLFLIGLVVSTLVTL